MRFIINIFVYCVIIGTSFNADKGPFTKLYSDHGFDVKFIFYNEGTGTQNNGVVILLINNNNFKISYSFELIFRTTEKDKSVMVRGALEPGERRTGSNDGLYFLPFNDKSSIAEVGIKKVEIIKLE